MITHSSKWQAAEYQLLQQAHNDYFKGTLKKKRKKKKLYMDVQDGPIVVDTDV